MQLGRVLAMVNPWQMVDRRVATLFVGPPPAYAQDVSDAIRETPPNLVVCSMFCVGGMVAAEAAGIPFDVLPPNVYSSPRPACRHSGSAFSPRGDRPAIPRSSSQRPR